jgi:hypothetical protein
VTVRVDEAREQGPVTQLHQPGRRAAERHDVVGCTDGDDRLAADRDGVHRRMVGIHRDDVVAHEDDVRGWTGVGGLAGTQGDGGEAGDEPGLASVVSHGLPTGMRTLAARARSTIEAIVDSTRAQLATVARARSAPPMPGTPGSRASAMITRGAK